MKIPRRHALLHAAAKTVRLRAGTRVHVAKKPAQFGRQMQPRQIAPALLPGQRSRRKNPHAVEVEKKDFPRSRRRLFQTDVLVAQIAVNDPAVVHRAAGVGDRLHQRGKLRRGIGDARPGEQPRQLAAEIRQPGNERREQPAFAALRVIEKRERLGRAHAAFPQNPRRAKRPLRLRSRARREKPLQRALPRERFGDALPRALRKRRANELDALPPRRENLQNRGRPQRFRRFAELRSEFRRHSPPLGRRRRKRGRCGLFSHRRKA